VGGRRSSLGRAARNEGLQCSVKRGLVSWVRGVGEHLFVLDRGVNMGGGGIRGAGESTCRWGCGSVGGAVLS